MNRASIILSAAALLVALGALTQGVRVLSRQRERSQILRQHAAQLEEQLAAQRRMTETTQRELAVAESQLAQLPATVWSIESRAARERAMEIQTWLAHVKQLKQLFDQHPEQRIPEMRLLTDDDWLRSGKRSQLDSDENIRAALADVRRAAIAEFGRPLALAMRKYLDAGNPAPPAAALALAPYFENPADADALQNYEIITPNRPNGRAGAPVWSVQQKSPVDADYDERLAMSSDGGTGFANPPAAWIPNFRERLQQATKDYAAANHGAQPTNISDVIPLMNPPLEPSQAEKVIKMMSKDPH